MSSTRVGNTPYGIYCTVSFASGKEAGFVQSTLHQLSVSDLQSVALSGARLSALSDLDAFYKESSCVNWDGEGGLAVEQKSYENARKFISLMPRDWKKPEISADPDGEVSVEWHGGNRRRFSVSIGADERVSYAWLFGSERGNGTDTFLDEIPFGVATQVNRLA